ncbi:hypothetical protein DPMN_044803 [Dreissena polymorpha]|uniref:Uncharacterized protein n=1 Tax=Dreissena polymorpha TaxID=45954 RepID=A0A9D4HWR9_DREPO|nr:hypothetical protein DPMN_044803 [Dreissena polymorpha]
MTVEQKKDLQILEHGNEEIQKKHASHQHVAAHKDRNHDLAHITGAAWVGTVTPQHLIKRAL